MTSAGTHPPASSGDLDDVRAAGASDDPAAEAETIRDAVLAVRGVAGLYGGPFGEIATYLPGRRIPGIRSDSAGTEIHLILREGTDLRATAQEVHRAVAAVTGTPVRVQIDDLAPNPEES